MSDLGIIIPVAIVLVVALSLGSSSSGSSKPDEEEIFDEYYAGRFQGDFATREDTKTVRSDMSRMTSATEARFDRDRQGWMKNPGEGKALLTASKEIFTEVSQGVQRIKELAQALDGVQDQDEDSMAMAEKLDNLLEEHEKRYSDFQDRDILKYYTKELQQAEEYITNSIMQNNENFMYGGTEPMPMEERKFVIQKITEMLQEISTFSDNQHNVLYRARESLKIHRQMDEPDDDPFLNAGAPASEMGGYAISETNTAFGRTIPASQQFSRSAFTQVGQGGLNRIPNSAPPDLPDVPEPEGGAVKGSFFSQPKSLNTQIQQSKLRTIREDAMNIARPLTPVQGITTANQGSPDFRKSESKVRQIINRGSKLDDHDQAVFIDELKALQGQLNVAKRNKDQRGLEKVRRKINNSAPPGTAKGAFYAVKLNRESAPRKLDFSNDPVKNTPSYKAWLKIANNAENAVL